MNPPVVVGLDLDGTLLDTERRHKAALVRAAQMAAVSLPSGIADAYYEAKREGLTGVQALTQLGIDKAREIGNFWFGLIEDEDLLALDSLYPWVMGTLETLARDGVAMYICTARQHSDRVIGQVSRLGIRSLVRDVFVASQGGLSASAKSKFNLTRELGLTVVVGDSEADQAWAEQLGVKFLAVGTGARSEEYWQQRGIKPQLHAGLALKSLNLLS